ncbi:hypothetical protein NLO82_27355, partial [Escherichia coli]|nr:hypothetical protein [Escherichia coli]
MVSRPAVTLPAKARPPLMATTIFENVLAVSASITSAPAVGVCNVWLATCVAMEAVAAWTSANAPNTVTATTAAVPN